MKKTNILLAALVACIGLAMTPQAQAQSYSPNALTWTNTTGLVAPSTAIWGGSGTTFFCGKQQNVSLGIQVALSNAASTVLTFAIGRSIDNSNFTTPATPDALVAVTVGAAAGTNYVVITNLPTSLTAGSGYLRVHYVTNSHASNHVTNMVVKVATKTMSP